MRMRHSVPEIKIKGDLNFSAIAHSEKQILVHDHVGVSVRHSG